MSDTKERIEHFCCIHGDENQAEFEAMLAEWLDGDAVPRFLATALLYELIAYAALDYSGKIPLIEQSTKRITNCWGDQWCILTYETDTRTYSVQFDVIEHALLWLVMEERKLHDE